MLKVRSTIVNLDHLKNDVTIIIHLKSKLYFKKTINENGIIVILLLKQLFDKLIPKTCEYFKQLCLDKTKGYTNSYVHRIDVDNGFIQAGSQ